MKRVILSSTKQRSPEKAYVYQVCEQMNWNLPMFCDRTKDGYKCKWGGRSFVGRIYHQLEEELYNEMGYDFRTSIISEPIPELPKEQVNELWDEAWSEAQSQVNDIIRETGVNNIHLNRNGNLIIPYAPVTK